MASPLIFSCKFIDRDEVSYDQMLRAATDEERAKIERQGPGKLEVLNFAMDDLSEDEEVFNKHCRILIFNFNEAFSLIKNETVDIRLSNILEIMPSDRKVYEFKQPYFQVVTY